MVEILTLDRIRSAGWTEHLLQIITSHLKDPTDSNTRDKILSAIERGGIVSKEVMAVVGTLQRQGITTAGLYKDLVTMSDQIIRGKAPSVVETPPQAVETTPAPTTPEPVVASETEATSPHSMTSQSQVSMSNAHPAGKPSGNIFRRKSSSFFFLEVMRDGKPRTWEEAVDVAMRRWPVEEIGENGSILNKMNWNMFLRHVKEGKANTHGYVYSLEKLDANRVRLVVKAPGEAASTSSPTAPEPPADALPAWADSPAAVTTASQANEFTAVTQTHPDPAEHPEHIPAEVADSDVNLLVAYKRAVQNAKEAMRAMEAAESALNDAKKAYIAAVIAMNESEERLLAGIGRPSKEQATQMAKRLAGMDEK